MISVAAITDSITASVTIYANLTVNRMLLKNYETTASATQTFADFIGYDLDDMYINLQGAGNMGHLSGLNAARKMVTGWDNTTGIMTFKAALSAGYQITIIGTN